MKIVASCTSQCLMYSHVNVSETGVGLFFRLDFYSISFFSGYLLQVCSRRSRKLSMMAISFAMSSSCTCTHIAGWDIVPTGLRELVLCLQSIQCRDVWYWTESCWRDGWFSMAASRSAMLFISHGRGCGVSLMDRWGGLNVTFVQRVHNTKIYLHGRRALGGKGGLAWVSSPGGNRLLDISFLLHLRSSPR